MSRFLKGWCLLTTMLTALSMGVALCHFLEMPAKLQYDGALWLTLLQTLYPLMFGSLGAFFELGAVIATLVLAALVRRRHAAFGWVLVAAICLIATQAVFWTWVAPINATIVPLTPATLPANWMKLRNQWEYGHVARAMLQIIALGALVFSILIEIPTTQPHSIAEQIQSKK